MKSPVRDYILKKYDIDLLKWKPQIPKSPLKNVSINKILAIDLDELIKGIKVEYEHTGDPIIAMEIAFAHILEIKDYYTRLLKMEAEAKKELAIKETLDKESNMNKNNLVKAHNYLLEKKEELGEELFEMLYGEKFEKIEAIMEEGIGKHPKHLIALNKDIEKYKKILNMRAKVKGVKENFGQDKVRALRDKYDVAGDYSFVGKKMQTALKSFDTWCSNFSVKEDIDDEGVSEAVEFNKRNRSADGAPTLTTSNKNLMLQIAYVVIDAPELWNVVIMDTKDDYQPIDKKDNPMSFKTIDEVIKHSNKYGFKISKSDFVKFLDVM